MVAPTESPAPPPATGVAAEPGKNQACASQNAASAASDAVAGEAADARGEGADGKHAAQAVKASGAETAGAGQAQAQASAAAAAGGLGGAAAAQDTLKIGDLVLTQFSRWKEFYDGKKGRITEKLSREYKVQILEGPAKNEKPKKFVFHNVKPYVAKPDPFAASKRPSPAESSGASAAPPEKRPRVEDEADEMFGPLVK